MGLLFDVCMFALISSVVVGFTPIRSGGRIATIGRERTAPRFVAMSPLDNWIDDEDDDGDEGDYDFESTPSGNLVPSPGVAISVSKLLDGTKTYECIYHSCCLRTFLVFCSI